MATVDTKTLIERIATASGIDNSDVESMVDALANVMREKCCESDTIAVPGFGTFETRKRSERLNIHPSTGKRMLLPPKIVLSFKPSALLKQKLNPSD